MPPIRVQRKRTKGWRMPANTVYVGRPTIWGNRYTAPEFFYVPGFSGTLTHARQACVDRFEYEMNAYFLFRERVKFQLAGKNLACWCPLDQPCHADVLLKIANSPG